MNNSLVTFIVGVVVVMAAAPTLVCLAGALVPLVIVVAISAAMLRLIWHYTNRL